MTPRTQHGFTLVEVMIAMTILAIGTLGLLGMQTVSITRNADAYQMTIASSLANDMMERIVYNRGHLSAYRNITTTDVLTKPPTTEPMARGDFEQWAALVAQSGLDQATGIITITPQDKDPVTTLTSIGRQQVTIRITWLGPPHNGIRQPHAVSVNTFYAPE